MESIRAFLIAVISFIASALSFAFGGWNQILMLLMIAVILDYALGVLLAFMKGDLSSKVGWRGIAKKVILFSLIAVAHIVDVILGSGNLVRNATILFYLCNECISIIEHAAKAGIPIPKFLLNALEGIKDQSEKNHDKDKTKTDKEPKNPSE